MPGSRPYRWSVLPLVAGAFFAAGANAQVILGLPDTEATATAARQPPSASLQSGMAAIRKLVRDVHSLITHRRLPPDQARRFATDLKRYVTALKANTSEPRLNEILTLLAEAAEQIGAPVSGNSHLDALDKIDAALNRYPQLIDDPEWKPLR